ncbi:MAG TPA: POTRA domain-containing protein [Candidatus Acidoferrales bacterium]|jgi:outer membrane protein assembly factor BamA|nr:POTRA domain-containing protein [Candidatus Acidoferrales bacterium]
MRHRSWYRLPIFCGFCVALIVFALAPAGSAAQEGSSRLDSLQVTGSARFTSAQLAPATGLQVGSQVTRDDLQKAANTLAQLGSFSTVNYRFSSGDAGVHVEYQVTDGPEIPVSFDNFPGFTDDELKAAIKSGGVLFDGQAPEHGAILDDISDALAKAIAARGMNFAVSHSVVIEPSGDKVQQFHIEGGAIKIASIDFSDALAQSDPGIHARMGDIVGRPFSHSAIDLFEFEQVRPVYLTHAFLQVHFDSPETKFANGAVDVVVRVVPGPAFTWGGVTWTGNTAVGVLDLDTAIPLHAGAPANGMKIEAGWEAAREVYMRDGYLDVDFKPVPKFDSAGAKVTYSVAVTEGPQYHMGKLVLSGLSIDGESRARAAWRIPPGAVFDEHVYEEFLSSGIQQAFSGFPFHYEKIGRFLQKNPASDTVDVMLDFQ